MVSRNVLRIVGCGTVFLASVWAFQRPFRQYPGREYGDFPLPPDWQQPAEWVFARLMIEENVVSAAGAHHRASEEELRRIIRDAGFVPKQRDTLYRTYFLN